MAARATFDLNTGVWFRRGRLLIVSPVRQPYWPLSGRNSTYPAVQILEAISVDAIREQAPEDDAGRDKGQRFGNILVKHDGEQKAQRRDHRAHRKRQPERAEQREPKP